MSTYSSLKFELILTGDQSGQWGNTTNTNIGTAINEAIAGSVDITFASADLTLTLVDSNVTQSARNVRLNLTGTSGGVRILTLGSGCQISKPYIVNNGLADAVTVKNTSGTGISVPAGKTMWLFNNGTNVVDVVSHLSSLTLATALPVTSGGTGVTTSSGTGAVVLNNSPTLTTPQFANSGYLADTVGNRLLSFSTVTNAVNYIQVANKPTNNPPVLAANGTDTNISLRLEAKGTGKISTNVDLLIGGFVKAGNGVLGTASNTIFGEESLQNDVSSSNTTVMGYRAGAAITSASYTTAFGSGAAQAVTTSVKHTAVGYFALNTMSNQGEVGYEWNGDTAIGNRALQAHTGTASITDCTAVGSGALRKLTTGVANVAVGNGALYESLTNIGNTAVGYNAGLNLVSGSNNTILGNGAQASTTTVSNEITLGNSSIATLRCQITSITALSDVRDKYDIEDLPVGLDFINSLKARRFKWDKRDAYFDEVETENGPPTKVAVPKDGSRKSDEWNEGFIAQEVDEAATAAGVDWMNLVYKSNPEKLEMTPGKLIPVLVKAVQELTARLEALEARN